MPDEEPTVNAVLRMPGGDAHPVPMVVQGLVRPAPLLPYPNLAYIAQQKQRLSTDAVRPSVPPPSANYLASKRGTPPESPMPPETYIAAERSSRAPPERGMPVVRKPSFEHLAARRTANGFRPEPACINLTDRLPAGMPPGAPPVDAGQRLSARKPSFEYVAARRAAVAAQRASQKAAAAEGGGLSAPTK